MKKPPNLIEKNEKKMEDEGKCKWSMKKSPNNQSHIESRFFCIKKKQGPTKK